jgi:hypothetical protein
MSEIFSFKKDRSTSVSHHWHLSSTFTSDDIDKIQDPNLDSNSINITSIPSPFARLDLVWTAFKKCKDALDGDTLYHKLVSEALDVGQILFTLEKFKGNKKLELVSWDQAKGLERLKSSNNSSHKLLGKTLSMYIDEDNAAYGFKNFDKFIFLKRNQDIVLGGLSPVTLFFSSAEAKNNSSLDIRLDRRDGTVHKVFETISPLYQRSKIFQAYLLWQLDKVKSESKHPISKDFIEYINNNLKKLSDSDRNEILKEKENLTGKLKDLIIGANETVRLGDISLKEYISDSKEIESQSDFIICSEKFFEDEKNGGGYLRKKYKYLPLVLSSDFGETNFQYTTMVWKANEFNVPVRDPIVDPERIFDRTLPGTNDKYPYLLGSDFLEDFIVKIPYRQDSKHFFVPKFNNSDTKDYSFLFPIKPILFDFFNSKEIEEMIEINELSNGSVTVTLKIPIGKNEKKHSIKLSKLYFGSEIFTDIEKLPIRDVAEKKEGYLVQNTFGFALFPPIYQIKTNAHYRILLVDNEVSLRSEYKLLFGKNETYSKLDPAKEPPKKRLTKTDVLKIDSQYYVIDDNFDFIQLSRGEGKVKSLIIPKWSIEYNPGGSMEAIFAIDFGTTNTHIEYKIGDSSEQAFEYENKEKQVAILNSESLNQDFPNIQAVFEKEFVPLQIGKNQFLSYPHRTVATHSKKLESNKTKSSVSDVLIGFSYGKMDVFEEINEVTDLKWKKKNSSTEDTFLELYLEQIAYMIRNKCLYNNIELKSVKLAITFPSSMSSSQQERINRSWITNYKKYFSNQDEDIAKQNILKISESIAPYYSFPGTTDNINSSVNIDIGGGTTDIVVFKQGKPLASTSFRFAATSIFGSGIPDTDFGVNGANGYVKKFLDITSDRLIANKKSNYAEIQKRIAQKNQASLLADFWLSLSSLPEFDSIVTFSKELGQGGNHKLPFLLFYTSIIYYVANFVKSLENIAPRNILFSGMGSKVLNILTSDSETLNKLTRVILNYVFQDYYSENQGKNSLIEVKREMNNPKEITAKGAIKAILKNEASNQQSIKELNRTYLGVKPYSENSDSNLNYEVIDGNHPAFNQSIEEIKEFYEFFFLKLPDLFDIEDHFGIEKPALNKYFNLAMEDSIENSLKGLNQKKGEDTVSRKLEETIFFYPITAMINYMGSK